LVLLSEFSGVSQVVIDVVCSELNFELLQQLSWDNCGVPRRIYEDSDAADQLENFFIEFSQPLLRDLRWEWPDGIEERSLASPQSNTEVYFGGGEICTVGAFKPNENKNLTSERASQLVSGLKVSASARSQLAGSTDGGESQLKLLSLAPSAASMSLGKSNSSRRLFQQTKNLRALSLVPKEGSKQKTIESKPVPESVPPGFAERLWAHLRIKALLRESVTSSNEQEFLLMRDEALQLALQYSLVTPLTSLVVIEPEDMSGMTTTAAPAGAPAASPASAPRPAPRPAPSPAPPPPGAPPPSPPAPAPSPPYPDADDGSAEAAAAESSDASATVGASLHIVNSLVTLMALMMASVSDATQS